MAGGCGMMHNLKGRRFDNSPGVGMMVGRNKGKREDKRKEESGK